MGIRLEGHRGNEKGFYGESIRLSNELLRSNLNIETCTLLQINEWLYNRNIKKSQSIIMFVFRIISIRFPTEFTQIKRNAHPMLKLELELIESQSKNEIEWFGKVGFQNNVRLDGSLTNNKIKSIIKNDGIVSRYK